LKIWPTAITKRRSHDDSDRRGEKRREGRLKYRRDPSRR
jgi:hypothetical protein